MIVTLRPRAQPYAGQLQHGSLGEDVSNRFCCDQKVSRAFSFLPPPACMKCFSLKSHR